jgi:hypothetical protein
MMKTYTVRLTFTAYIDSPIDATSQKDAVERAKNGEGDFADMYMVTTYPKFKVVNRTIEYSSERPWERIN